MSKYLEQRLKRDAQFLNNIFSNIEHMEGTVIVLENDKGYDKYKSIIGDPMEEQTLIIGDDMDRVILFFNHLQQVIYRCIWPGVTVKSGFSYNECCFMHKKCKPEDMPPRLQKYVLDSIEGAFGNLAIASHPEAIRTSGYILPSHTSSSCMKSSRQEQGERDEASNFLKKHYKKGGMVLLKNVKANAEWNDVYRYNLEIKKVHICKSCNAKWAKGCCSEYSQNNRTMRNMVIGWSLP